LLQSEQVLSAEPVPFLLPVLVGPEPLLSNPVVGPAASAESQALRRFVSPQSPFVGQTLHLQRLFVLQQLLWLADQSAPWQYRLAVQPVP
jgi:hypothetical protein